MTYVRPKGYASQMTGGSCTCDIQTYPEFGCSILITDCGGTNSPSPDATWVCVGTRDMNGEEGRVDQVKCEHLLEAIAGLLLSFTAATPYVEQLDDGTKRVIPLWISEFGLKYDVPDIITQYWVDESWRQDSAPKFHTTLNGENYFIMCEHPMSDQRENTDNLRFYCWKESNNTEVFACEDVDELGMCLAHHGFFHWQGEAESEEDRNR